MWCLPLCPHVCGMEAGFLRHYFTEADSLKQCLQLKDSLALEWGERIKQDGRWSKVETRRHHAVEVHFPSCHSATGPQQRVSACCFAEMKATVEGARHKGERLLHIHCRLHLPVIHLHACSRAETWTAEAGDHHRIQLHVHLRVLSLIRQPTNCSLKRRELAGVELEQFISRLSSRSQKRVGSCPLSVGTQKHTHTLQRWITLHETKTRQNTQGWQTFHRGAAILLVPLHSPLAVWRYHWSVRRTQSQIDVW